MKSKYEVLYPERGDVTCAQTGLSPIHSEQPAVDLSVEKVGVGRRPMLTRVVLPTPVPSNGVVSDQTPIIDAHHEVEPKTESPESCTDETSWDSSEKSVSVQKYEEEWNQLYCGDDQDLGELRRKALLGNLRASRFRSVCWRYLLGVLPPDPAEWLLRLRECRKHYSQILLELSIDPWDRDEPEDNPLSQKAESIWHQYFCDKELRAVIRQDVVRTFPGVDFFRKETIQDAMVNILFCYARENPIMCYRQGMHEILAPLMFVLHCDHQALLHTKEQLAISTLFTDIMSSIESCYRINDLTPTRTGYFPANTQRSPDGLREHRAENEVVAQLNSIRDKLLAPHDPELHQHLQDLDIPLPLFGIRWLRLLFGREFPLQDLLVLWDAIFAEGQKFELVNYIVVAMLIAIRFQLLEGDYTTCLTYLMRYPGAVDITYIIEHALFLKDPQKHCVPAMTTFPNLPVVTVGGRRDLNRAGQQPPSKDNKSLGRKKTDLQVAKLTGSRIKLLSSRSVPWTKGRMVQSQMADADTIVDGYTLNDPALLREEIEHARAVMTLCRIKLAQYHAALCKVVPQSAPPDALQALDGIHELCSLLNVRPHAEVEPAFEAGEMRHEHQRSIPPPSNLHIHPHHSKDTVRGVHASPPKSDVAMEVFSQVEGKSIIGAPLKDPTWGRRLLIVQDRNDRRLHFHCRYEDISKYGSLLQQTDKLIGNKH
uniref:Rab-GAP TBC domain-containing protein n=1 Tax=Timema genevievae TaxID=629358 RepID=A0A7R9JRN3_TIMGE|nr:unnamed protein product [Timema genevievae]